MAALLRSSLEGNTQILTIQNREHRNALTPEMSVSAIEALTTAESNPDVRSIIVTGNGTPFCSGINMQQLMRDALLPDKQLYLQLQNLSDWMEGLRTCSKPTIAAVEGMAADAGFALALACDFLTAARDAQFFMTNSRFYLTQTAGITELLSRRLPPQSVNEILMLGRIINSERLYQLGIVNTLAESGHTLEAALKIAGEINQRESRVLAETKELINECEINTREAQAAAENKRFIKNLKHPEFRSLNQRKDGL